MIQNLLSSPASIGATTQSLFDSIQRIVGGQRINEAGDDPAGAAVVAKFDSIASSDRQAVRATNDGMSIAQTIDGAADTVQENLVKMRELSVAAASDTSGEAARAAFQDQVEQLADEINRTAETTEFNGIPLTEGSLDTIEVQASSDGADQIAIDTADLTTSALGVDGLDLSDSAGAQASIDAIDAALKEVGKVRSDVGAQHNRLASAAEAGSARVIDQQTAASQIADSGNMLGASENASAQLRLDASIAAKVQSRNLLASTVTQLIG